MFFHLTFHVSAFSVYNKTVLNQKVDWQKWKMWALGERKRHNNLHFQFSDGIQVDVGWFLKRRVCVAQGLYSCVFHLLALWCQWWYGDIGGDVSDNDQ